MMPHFHLKRLTWTKDWRLTTRNGKIPVWIISSWDRCNVCGFIRNPVTVECTGDPDWVIVY